MQGVTDTAVRLHQGWTRPKAQRGLPHTRANEKTTPVLRRPRQDGHKGRTWHYQADTVHLATQLRACI